MSKIIEVISDYVTLKKTGRNYIGLCPFHAEKSPSFTVNEEKGIFNCFGCQTGGDVAGFIAMVLTRYPAGRCPGVDGAGDKKLIRAKYHVNGLTMTKLAHRRGRDPKTIRHFADIAEKRLREWWKASRQ